MRHVIQSTKIVHDMKCGNCGKTFSEEASDDMYAVPIVGEWVECPKCGSELETINIDDVEEDEEYD